MSVANEETLNLGVKERLELIEEISDSIAAHPQAIPLTAARRKELERRRREHKRDPSRTRPWSQVHNELKRRTK